MKIEDAVREVADGAEVSVFCAPRAGRDAVTGLHGDALKVRVRAPALEGRANDAVLTLLAAGLGVPRARVRLEAGARSRMKRVRVTGLTRSMVVDRLSRMVADERSR
ncbi:MAG: DUF167 domain-containing protein [Actinomycetota bacterium]